MYKYKNKKDNVSWSCCPLGTVRDSNVIECYYYGLVRKDYCQNCKVRKDNLIVKKR